MIFTFLKKKKASNEIGKLQKDKEKIQDEIKKLSMHKSTLNKEITDMSNKKNNIEAEILSVELWDRDKLLQILCKNFEFNINNIDKKIYRNNKNAISNDDDDDNDEVIDPLLMEAIEMCIEVGQASASCIQRRLKVGYSKAERIIEQMEEMGIISGYQGSKPREILITKEKWRELNEKNNKGE